MRAIDPAKARQLDRWTTANTLYTLCILLPAIIYCAALAMSGSLLFIPIFIVTFSIKFWINKHWDDLFEEITGIRSPLR